MLKKLGGIAAAAFCGWLSRSRAAMFAVLLAATAGTALAQVSSLYYREVEKNGRIYVFNTSERFASWQSTGEIGTCITLIGRGPNGEALIGENEAAVDLYLFKHNLPAYERQAPPPPAPASPALPQVKIGALGYISYQDGKSGGKDFSRFTLKRGYISVDAKILPFLSARLTPDVTQDTTGDWKVRMKYLYGKLETDALGFITKPYIELGLAHMPWLDFEEHINAFRLQDTMFTERVGLFDSADVGAMAGGLLGREMGKDFQANVSKSYPGRFGSFQVGVYNGGGYHAAEQNTNKVLEGRLTVRSLPDLVPGLQLSYFGVTGKGNTAAEPDWTLSSGMLSYESAAVVLTGQYVRGKGSQKGDAVDAAGKALPRDGWSGFVEGKLGAQWSLIGRWDRFNPDTDAVDLTTKRTIAGIAYKLGGGSIVLLDWDRLAYDKAGKPDDTRWQLTLQVDF